MEPLRGHEPDTKITTHHVPHKLHIAARTIIKENEYDCVWLGGCNVELLGKLGNFHVSVTNSQSQLFPIILNFSQSVKLILQRMFSSIPLKSWYWESAKISFGGFFAIANLLFLW